MQNAPTTTAADTSRQRLNSLQRFLQALGEPQHDIEARRVFTSTFWLWSIVALVLALSVRLFILARANGMMEGDEAVLAIQAEQILQGHLPIYFYGQDYMGSWDAYLLAPVIALFGPSAAAIRAVMTAESLLLVPLTGILATKLFGQRAVIPALIFAALPPLLPMTVQMRMWGGYTETLVLGTALMLVVVSIAERWDQQKSTTWLWALGGLLAGFALWVDPLIAYYLIACTCWLGGLAVARAYTTRRYQSVAGDVSHSSRQRTPMPPVIVSVIATLGGAVLGAGPALYFAVTSGFKNVLQFTIGSKSSQSPLHFFSTLAIIRHFISSALLHVAGIQPFWAVSVPSLIPILLGVVVGLIEFAALLYVLGRVASPRFLSRWPGFKVVSPNTARQRWNDAFPLILGAVIVVVYLVHSYGSDPNRYVFVERYLIPLLTVGALILARFFGDLPTLVRPLVNRENTHPLRSGYLSTALLVVLLVMFAAPYTFSNMTVVMRSPWAPGYSFPAQHEEMVGYLTSHHIHYVWTSHWVGNVVMYLSNQQVLCSDYVDIAQHAQIRFPQADDAVAAADRPSFIMRSHAPPGQSRTEQALTALGVKYQAVRFAEYIVITPLSRTVQPQEILHALELEE